MIDSSTSRTSIAYVRGLRTRPLAAACTTALLFVASSAIAADNTAPTATDAGTNLAQSNTPNPTQPTDKKKKEAENAAASLDTVTVTGIKASIESSLQAKQSSDEIIETIRAEDLGKLPDISIAESLARLPGLATQRVNGRAEYISIRGTDPGFVGTTLNGREQASSGENRGVQYDQYPAELITGADVYKTPNASLIGQGLSGTIDLHSIKPLDFKDMTMAVNLRGEHNANGQLNPGTGVNKNGNRASFSFVDQFFDHTLGVAVGVAHLDSPVQEKQYQAWWWSMDNGPGSANQNWGGPYVKGMPDSVISQEGMQLRAKSTAQNRDGLMSVIEWAPTENYHSTVDMYYSKFQQEAYKNGLQWSSSPWDGVSYSNVGTTYQLPYPIATSGTINNLKTVMQNEYNKERDYLFSAGWNNRFDFGNQWQGVADLSYSRAKVKIRDAYAFTGLKNQQLISSGFVTPVGNGYSAFTPSVDLTNAALVGFTDPYGYGYNGRAENDWQKDSIKAVRVEVSHPLGWIFSSMNLGANYSERTKTKQADVFFAWLLGNGNKSGNYNNNFWVPIGASLYAPTNLGYGGVGGILDYDVLGALAKQFYLTQNMGKDDWSRNYTIKEKVPLVYAKFNIDTDLAGMPLRGNVGFQYVHTDQSSTSLQTNGDTFVGQIAGSTTYNKLLPSLNLVADLGNGQDLRFGLAKTMTRGRMDDEKVASSVYTYKVTQGPQTGQVLWSGSGGNPYLKPYIAVGTDLAYDYFFGEASAVSIAIFSKNLLNYIYSQTITNYNFAGYINPNPTLTPNSSIGSFTTPQNGTGGRMQGVEFNAVLEGKLFAQWLDGFGLQSNFTFTNSFIPTSSVSSIPGGPSSLPGLSKKVGNVVFYYEKNGVSVRLAQRYRSDATGEATLNFGQLGYQKILADKQTDFQAGYDFGEGRLKGLSVLLQVNNVTNSPYRTQQISGLPNGVSIARPLDFNTYGRTILFGVNYKL
ncbi:MAG: TonB-dependent receptor [Proteobacteria bacterium]|nr:TonB-dependent receptor [Pseudomonadota bacterium]